MLSTILLVPPHTNTLYHNITCQYYCYVRMALRRLQHNILKKGQKHSPMCQLFAFPSQPCSILALSSSWFSLPQWQQRRAESRAPSIFTDELPQGTTTAARGAGMLRARCEGSAVSRWLISGLSCVLLSIKNKTRWKKEMLEDKKSNTFLPAWRKK